MTDYDKLKNLLQEMDGVLIGYSGGVDSTLLGKVATDVLGDRSVCVLIESCLIPESEIDDAVTIAQELGLNLIRLEVDVLSIDNVSDNELDRCYHCKKALFSILKEIASERGMDFVLDGANSSDQSDFRPGSSATKELGVRSPFKELSINKERIRAISRELGLRTWNKPSYACTASRVPYGTRLTPEILKQIESAEAVLTNLGFGQFRVRHHGNVARIELMPLEMEKIINSAVRSCIVREFRELGYKYVSLDLAGYRTGSMNEVLNI